MITVAGLAPSLDITYLVDHLRLGEIHRPTAVVRCPGGKPLNMVRAAATLGADAAVVAVLGGPTGAALRSALVESGVAVDVVETPAETRTCVSIASADSHALTEVYELAAPVPPEVWTRFVETLTAAVADRPGWLSISGGPPRDLAPDALAGLVGVGSGRVRVALDTHGRGLPAAVGAGPDLVKINRPEAAALLDVSPNGDLLAMAAGIRDRGVPTVVLTDGSAGAVAVDEVTALRARLYDVRGPYPVGSGDSFLAGLLVELDAGRPLAEALRTATAAGTANALVPGPGRLDAATVADLRSRVVVEPADAT